MNKLYEFIKERKMLCISLIMCLSTIFMGLLYFKQVDASEAFTCPKENETEDIEVLEDSSDGSINVDIKGAVENPGVYKVPEGSVVNDLIDMAGGLTMDADTKNINLSKRLENEMVIVIYTKDELKDKLALEDATIDDSLLNQDSIINNDYDVLDDTTSKKVSLNTATLEELISLPGLGEAKAKAIIDYRSACGYFKKIEDLKNIKGIGDAVFKKLEPYITV